MPWGMMPIMKGTSRLFKWMEKILLQTVKNSLMITPGRIIVRSIFIGHLLWDNFIPKKRIFKLIQRSAL